MTDTGEYIVELIPQGQFVKATAVDVRSGREVSIVGSARASQNDIRKLAIKKLVYVMTKERKNLEEQTCPNKPKGLEV